MILFGCFLKGDLLGDCLLQKSFLVKFVTTIFSVRGLSKNEGIQIEHLVFYLI